jgi:predicted O-linked N-acetylglucosamine transferase (SPINDLY family)
VSYRRALALQPTNGIARSNLGLALQEKGELEEAIDCFTIALETHPELTETRDHLAKAWRELGNLDQSIDNARRALDRNPQSPEALCTLGISLKEAAGLDEAVVLLRRAMEYSSDPTIGSDFLYAIHLHPDYDAKRIYDEHARWHEKYLKPLGFVAEHHDNDRSPGRRLRIGYLSSDFREHSVGRFILPLLANHQHDQFEICC